MYMGVYIDIYLLMYISVYLDAYLCSSTLSLSLCCSPVPFLPSPRVHNLYDFQTLKATCSYFKGCPLTKIDESISTELPELLERYRRLVDAALASPASKNTRAGPVPAPSIRGNVPAAATARTS